MDKKKKTMTEKEMMEDGLSSQKQISANYNTCANECSSDQLRSAFLNILTEEQDMGAQIFSEMSSRGWYQVKEAEESEIVKVKEKFLKS